MKDNRAPPDNLASRVLESYRLDEQKFRPIVNRLYEEVEKVAAASEATGQSKPIVLPLLDGGEILIQGEYRVGDKGNTLFWDYVGRLVGGVRIGKHGLYLQTFKPPKDCPLSATSHPNVLELLREYII